jgi:hypothetical protein
MRRRRIRLALAGPLLVLVLGAASACQSTGANDGAASQGNGSASAGDTAAAQQYAQCIRENGVPDFPDPGPDPDRPFANLNLQGLNREALAKAMEACQDKAPEGLLPQPNQEQAEKWRQFAQCMRDSGYDIPDPDPNTSFPDWARTWNRKYNPNDAKFQEAAEPCLDKAGMDLGGRNP